MSGLVLCVAWPLFTEATQRSHPLYQIGETSKVEVVTPVKVVVIDPEATEKLKLEEARRVRIICRFDPGAVEEAVDILHRAFAENREKFLDRVEWEFQKRQLNSSQAASIRFRRLSVAFESENQSIRST